MKKTFKNQGFSVLLVMIIVTAAIVIIALGMGLSSITENQINLNQSKSARMLSNIDGCGEEAIIQLNRDNSYDGETIIIDDTSCVIEVAGEEGANRTINITGTNNYYTKRVQINVMIFPTFQVTSWQETTN